jgi:hypothetical protein
MAGLLQLPVIERRRLKLRLEAARERLGLDGSHHSWLNDPVRRAKAREQRIQINSETCYINEVFHDQVTGPISSQAELDASLNHPYTSDSIGLTETMEYLVESFNAGAEAYFSDWSKESKPYEDFVALLDAIKLWAIEECSVLWPDRGDWVKRRVVPAADDCGDAAVAWRDKARAEELARLETSAKTKPGTAPTHKAATHTVNESADVAIPTKRINGKRFQQIRLGNNIQKGEVGSASTIDRIEKDIPVKPQTLDAAIRKLAKLLEKQPRDLRIELEAD